MKLNTRAPKTVSHASKNEANAFQALQPVFRFSLKYCAIRGTAGNLKESSTSKTDSIPKSLTCHAIRDYEKDLDSKTYSTFNFKL